MYLLVNKDIIDFLDQTLFKNMYFCVQLQYSFDAQFSVPLSGSEAISAQKLTLRQNLEQRHSVQDLRTYATRVCSSLIVVPGIGRVTDPRNFEEAVIHSEEKTAI